MRRSLTSTPRAVLFAIVLGLLAPVAASAALSGGSAHDKLAALRLPFIANDGQVDAAVAYYAPTFAGTLFVTQQGQLVYSLPGRRAAAAPGWSLTETFRGGTARPAGREAAATRVSSFIGADPTRWRPDLATYPQLELGEVWPGVTVALRAHGRSVEKIFTVAPGASADRIRMRVSGASALRVGPDGALVARTGVGEVSFSKPVAYQDHDGARRAVPVAYRLKRGEYRFAVGPYDRTRPLVIDPLLQSTYLGGTGDDAANALAIHPTSGDVYVAGETGSTDFPGTTGGAQPIKAAGLDAFVARLNAGLTTLIRATYFGGSGDDRALAVAINAASGRVYVAGTTRSADLPHTAGGAQQTLAGDSDAFVARLSLDLTSLPQATYLGGIGDETGGLMGLAIVPTTGAVYVAGPTSSTDFPGTTGGAQSTSGGDFDVFVARLNADLTSLTQATYLGGGLGEEPAGLAIHGISGDVYVAGSTASTNFPGTGGGAQPAAASDCANGFVARLNAALTSLGQATYLGGSGCDQVSAVGIHPTSGEVYVAGGTDSTDFPGTAGGAQPTLSGFQSSFVARLNTALTNLLQATYLGGSFLDILFALAIHPLSGEIYLAGATLSTDLPGASHGAQPSPGGRFLNPDGFVTRMNAPLTSIEQSTYLGGAGLEIATAVAIHPLSGEVYVAGVTGSDDFPGTAGGAQPTTDGSDNGFVARLTADLAGPPDLTIVKVHGGTFAQGQIGATYLISITHVGGTQTSGTVSVTDTVPVHLTVTAMSGVGWSCTVATRTCLRADPLLRGESYPAITVTVNVAANAPLLVVNTATVSGGGDVTPANNTATDATVVFINFVDVPSSDPFYAWIGTIAAAGITGGCGTAPAMYCPDAPVTRGQIAVFILRGLHGADYTPPAATGLVFADVPTTHPFAAWIERLASEGLTGGCAPNLYCPDGLVSRGEAAVFLLRARHGAAYTPPPATGLQFTDVPLGHPFAAWIEQMADEGLTGGCGPTTFCPAAAVTRETMAVFLVRTFNLPI